MKTSCEIAKYFHDKICKIAKKYKIKLVDLEREFQINGSIALESYMRRKKKDSFVKNNDPK